MSTKTSTNHEIQFSSLKKILVVSFLYNEANRQKSEDELVHFLKDKGVASHTMFVKSLDLTSEAFQHTLEEQKFDGAILMRLIDIDREVFVKPGTPFSSYPNYYQNFNGLFYRSWDIYSTPNQLVMTKTYTVEITIYSLLQDKIIWSGITETISPSSIQRMTKEIAHVTYRKLKKDGLLVN
ncbi:MAG TPA: hypothetical protein PLU10_06750 [Chitinophagaceae bacterium]|nr:hypothetical protein [Chitinophagaceae bacterium]